MFIENDYAERRMSFEDGQMHFKHINSLIKGKETSTVNPQRFQPFNNRILLNKLKATTGSREIQLIEVNFKRLFQNHIYKTVEYTSIQQISCNKQFLDNLMIRNKRLLSSAERLNFVYAILLNMFSIAIAFKYFLRIIYAIHFYCIYLFVRLLFYTCIVKLLVFTCSERQIPLLDSLKTVDATRVHLSAPKSFLARRKFNLLRVNQLVAKRHVKAADKFPFDGQKPWFDLYRLKNRTVVVQMVQMLIKADKESTVNSCAAAHSSMASTIVGQESGSNGIDVNSDATSATAESDSMHAVNNSVASGIKSERGNDCASASMNRVFIVGKSDKTSERSLSIQRSVITSTISRSNSKLIQSNVLCSTRAPSAAQKAAFQTSAATSSSAPSPLPSSSVVTVAADASAYLQRATAQNFLLCKGDGNVFQLTPIGGVNSIQRTAENVAACSGARQPPNNEAQHKTVLSLRSHKFNAINVSDKKLTPISVASAHFAVDKKKSIEAKKGAIQSIVAPADCSQHIYDEICAHILSKNAPHGDQCSVETPPNDQMNDGMRDKMPLQNGPPKLVTAPAKCANILFNSTNGTRTALNSTESTIGQSSPVWLKQISNNNTQTLQTYKMSADILKMNAQQNSAKTAIVSNANKVAQPVNQIRIKLPTTGQAAGRPSPQAAASKPMPVQQLLIKGLKTVSTSSADKVTAKSGTKSEPRVDCSTMEQLKEFDMVYEQMKERSTAVMATLATPAIVSTAGARQLHVAAHNSAEVMQKINLAIIRKKSSDGHIYRANSGSMATVAKLNAPIVVIATTPMNKVIISPKTLLGDRPHHPSEPHQKSAGERQIDCANTANNSDNVIDSELCQNAFSNSLHSTSAPIKSMTRACSKLTVQTTNGTVVGSAAGAEAAAGATSGGGATQNGSIAAATSKQPNKLQDDEKTVQRIYNILAQYAEQISNSPDLNNKPAPRRRSNVTSVQPLPRNALVRAVASANAPLAVASSTPSPPSLSSPPLVSASSASAAAASNTCAAKGGTTIAVVSLPQSASPSRKRLRTTSTVTTAGDEFICGDIKSREARESSVNPFKKQRLAQTSGNQESNEQPSSKIGAANARSDCDSVGATQQLAKSIEIARRAGESQSRPVASPAAKTKAELMHAPKPTTAFLIAGKYLLPMGVLNHNEKLFAKGMHEKPLTTALTAHQAIPFALNMASQNASKKIHLRAFKVDETAAMEGGESRASATVRVPIMSICTAGKAAEFADPPAIVPMPFINASPMAFDASSQYRNINGKIILLNQKITSPPSGANQSNNQMKLESDNGRIGCDDGGDRPLGEQSTRPPMDDVMDDMLISPEADQNIGQNISIPFSDDTDPILDRIFHDDKTNPMADLMADNNNDDSVYILENMSAKNASEIDDDHDDAKEFNDRIYPPDAKVMIDKKKSDALTLNSISGRRNEHHLKARNNIERQLRLQKSLSEECEDLGVDEPSTSELFPEAELSFDNNSPLAFDGVAGHNSSAAGARNVFEFSNARSSTRKLLRGKCKRRMLQMNADVKHLAAPSSIKMNDTTSAPLQRSASGSASAAASAVAVARTRSSPAIGIAAAAAAAKESSDNDCFFDEDEFGARENARRNE